MSVKIDKQEAKKTDALTKELKKGFEWTQAHSQIVVILILSFLVIGGGTAAYQYTQDQKEVELQSQFFAAEKAFLEKRASLEMAENPPPPGSEMPAVKPQKSTGDMNQDYGSTLQPLQSLLEQSPQSKAAKMSALYLAETHLNYKKPTEAVGFLKKVDSSTKDLLSGLVKYQLGTALADAQNCSEAVQTWSQVIASKESSFLHPQAKLKQALCYEALGDKAQAQKLLEEVSSLKDSQIAETATKYLRLVQ
ncbi:MAG: tetratricopeptide repeat protein [Pseudobdellovibrionaceae bacterium]